MSDLAQTGYNHIDMLNLLANFPRAGIEAFQSNITQRSFAATSIAPNNANRVLYKLNLSLRTLPPPPSRPSSTSSQSTPRTPVAAIQLENQASKTAIV
jgi:hypothetical protein